MYSRWFLGFACDSSFLVGILASFSLRLPEAADSGKTVVSPSLFKDSRAEQPHNRALARADVSKHQELSLLLIEAFLKNEKELWQIGEQEVNRLSVELAEAEVLGLLAEGDRGRFLNYQRERLKSMLRSWVETRVAQAICAELKTRRGQEALSPTNTFEFERKKRKEIVRLSLLKKFIRLGPSIHQNGATFSEYFAFDKDELSA